MGIIVLLIIGYLGFRFFIWVFSADTKLPKSEQKKIEEEVEEIIFTDLGDGFK